MRPYPYVIQFLQKITRQMFHADRRFIVIQHGAGSAQHIGQLPEIAGPLMTGEKRQHLGGYPHRPSGVTLGT